MRAAQPLRASAAPSTSLDPFFSWVASAYPQFFSGASQDGTADIEGYGTIAFRHFDSGNYIGVANGLVYAYGWATNNTILPVGALDDYVCRVYPGNQGCASLTVASSVTGSLASMAAQGDHTMYLFAGVPYAFIARSTEMDTYLSLYNPDGKFVTANNNLSATSTNSAVYYTAQTTGLYRLAVSAAAGSGSYTLTAYVQASVLVEPGRLEWPDSINGTGVNDITYGDNFSFDSTTRCLYSDNRQQLLTDFCLEPGRTSGTFGGQPVKVIMAYSGPGRCAAVLADPTGFTVDIDTKGMFPVARKTNSVWDVYGCN